MSIADEQEYFGSIVHHVRQANCSIFIGAALSSIAGLPSAADLCEFILTHFPATGVLPEDRHDISKLTEAYDKLTRRPYDAHRLIASLISQKEHAASRDIYSSLCSLPFRNFVTTNYDRLLDSAIPGLDETSIVRTESQAALQRRRKRPFLLKMHGDVLNPVTMVLTYKDLTAYTADHPALTDLLIDLLGDGPFIFLGFSKQAQSFLEIARNYIASVREYGTPHPWFIVDSDRYGLPLRELRDENIAYLQMDLRAFITTLCEHMQEKAIIPWTDPYKHLPLVQKLLHAEKQLDRITTHYGEVATIIKQYQDPDGHILQSVVVNANIYRRTFERDKLTFTLE